MPPHPPELAAILFRRTLIASAAVALIVTLGLGTLTIVNVRQEVRAAQELVKQAVQASRQTAAQPGPRSIEPDHASLRGLRLRLIDRRSADAGLAADAAGVVGAPWEAGTRNLLERLAGKWFGVSDHFAIPLTNDPLGPALLVQGHAIGELQEQLVDMSIVLGALVLAVAALGLAHRWVMRGVREPLADMTRAAVSMAEGELTRRVPEPRVAEFASLARALNHLAGSLAQTRTMQAELTAELVGLREDERKSLARELHDDLGQRLAVLAAETHLLRARLKSDDAAVRSIAAGIQSLQHLVRSMLERLRQGRPMVLADPDVAAILDDWRRRKPGVQWTVENLDAGMLAAFDDRRRDALARVLQEALANAFRHSRPTSLAVRLLQSPQGWRLVIRNDGAMQPAGVDRGQPASPRRNGDGHGILGMSERAHGAGGELQAGPADEPGEWEVVLSLPEPGTPALETAGRVVPTVQAG